MAGTLLIRLALALVFACAGVAKLLDRKGFGTTLIAFKTPAVAVRPLSVAVPLVELAIAGLLIPKATAVAGAIAAAALLIVFSAAVGLALRRGDKPDCNCFGQAHSAPIGPSTLARNALLAALAVLVAAAGPGMGLGEVEVSATLVFAVVISIAMLALAAFTWQLFQQNGRLIERVRALEAAQNQEPPRADGPGEPVTAMPRLRVERVRGH